MDNTSRASRWPVVLVVAVIAMTLFMALGYPAMGRQLAGLTPPGSGFDTSLAYSPAEALIRASRYDEAAQQSLLVLHWTLDLAFPLTYGLLLVALWGTGLSLADTRHDGTDRSRSKPGWWLAVPLSGPVLDLLENTAVSILLATVHGAGAATGSGAAQPPALAKASAAAASVLTSAKWFMA